MPVSAGAAAPEPAETRGQMVATAVRSAALAVIAARPFLGLFAAGALSVTAMAPLHLWPVLCITLPLFFWALDEIARDAAARPWRRAFWLGWAFGFGYHLAGLYWIGFSFLVQAERFAALMPFAITLLTAGLGLFFAVAAAAYALLRDRVPGDLPRLLLFALVIAVAEWLRGHIFTGFPWNVLGYALTMPLPLMQWAGLFGIYGLTAITVIVLAAPLVIFAGRAQAPVRTVLATTIAPLCLAYLYGAWQLSEHPTSFVPDVKLRLVQPSFTQRDKFVDTKRWPIFLRHLELSAEGGRAALADAAPPLPPASVQPTHIIWPEASIPFFVRREQAAITAMAEALPPHVRVIAGTFRAGIEPGQRFSEARDVPVFNSAMVFAGNGTVESIYDKIHLVPFGEYLPAQPILSALGLENLTRTNGGLAIGSAPRELMRIGGLPPVAMLICYEASFPGAVVQTSERPGVLINLTNDAWFGATAGPHQHFHQTRLRAVEQGVPMLRSANNGISAIIDPVGRVVGRLALNQVAILDGGLPRAIATPLYARFGLIIECAIFFLLSGAVYAYATRSSSDI